MNEPSKNISQGQVVQPEAPPPLYPPGAATTKILSYEEQRNEAATVLAAHLFAEGDRNISGISYAVGYRLSDANAGGDIVDVYQFDNDAVSLSIADISGKGTRAAIHAALIKYGLRAYSSHGLTPEKAMRAMDRLYLENCSFENIESFATVFHGVVDPRRRLMLYSSAGHEPVILVHPHMEPRILEPTAPLIGVFEDQHHLFRQESTELWAGSLLVATTDGITEARNPKGEHFGMEGLIRCVKQARDAEPSVILDVIVQETSAFCGGPWRDDVAIVVARFA